MPQSLAPIGPPHRQLGKRITIASLQQFAEESLMQHVPHSTIIITGLNHGWDRAIAIGAVSLGYRISIIAPDYIMLADDPVWKWLAPKALQITTIPAQPEATTKIHNEARITVANSILALWDSNPGEIAGYITLAQSSQKPIANLWPQFLDFRRSL